MSKCFSKNLRSSRREIIIYKFGLCVRSCLSWVVIWNWVGTWIWVIIGRLVSLFHLSHFNNLSNWRTLSCNNVSWLMDGIVNFGSDLINLVFSIKISSHNIISFNKLVELSLEISVLLSQQERMFLQSFILWFQV